MLNSDCAGERLNNEQAKMPCPGYYIDLTGKLIYLDKNGNELPDQE